VPVTQRKRSECLRWLLALTAVFDVIYLIYLNAATPYTFTSNGNTVASTASQVNNICQNQLSSLGSSSMAYCRSAQSMEQQKAGFTVGLVIAAIALVVILRAFWSKTQGVTSQPGWYEDPEHRYPRRYYDGRAWTSRVSAGLGAPEQADKDWQEHPIITTRGE
jgi:hypothetical protein